MWIRNLFPRGLYSRAILILLLPVIAIQLTVSVMYIQRYFEGVTRQLSQSVLVDVDLIIKTLNLNNQKGTNNSTPKQQASTLAEGLGMELTFSSDAHVAPDQWRWDDLTARTVAQVLRTGVPDVLSIDMKTFPATVFFNFETHLGPTTLAIPRKRLSVRNPHQLLVIMVLASILMTVVAYIFLRKQLSPIANLAHVAEAFGRGENLPYQPQGATEVQAAGAAFLDMRQKIEKSIETRTLMLSGISHDLRTPLTRLRLGLSILPYSNDVDDLLADVVEMEVMVEEFLAFARGDTTEVPELCEPLSIIEQLSQSVTRSGYHLQLDTSKIDDIESSLRLTNMRKGAILRALENLVENAFHYADKVILSASQTSKTLCFVVEDNGPGIPQEQINQVVKPFFRLDTSRNRENVKNKKSGAVGLGLTIVTDIAHNHGGSLVLEKSEKLGGLKAILSITR